MRMREWLRLCQTPLHRHPSSLGVQPSWRMARDFWTIAYLVMAPRSPPWVMLWRWVEGKDCQCWPRLVGI